MRVALKFRPGQAWRHWAAVTTLHTKQKRRRVAKEAQGQERVAYRRCVWAVHQWHRWCMRERVTRLHMALLDSRQPQEESVGGASVLTVWDGEEKLRPGAGAVAAGRPVRATGLVRSEL